MSTFVYIRLSKILSLLLILVLIIVNILYSYFNHFNYIFKDIQIDLNFEFHNYERNFINKKILEKSMWMLSEKQAYFLNGVIRKFKPKNCLEIGVAHGGSSVLILNAIKDIKDSKLVSLDLNSKLFINNSFETGYVVEKYFPELINKWKLLTGDQPHKFLEKLQMRFDFLFLDTKHITPGEIINLIEALPFLNEGAIIVLHDIVWHFNEHKGIKEVKLTPTQIYLMSILFGQKKYLKSNVSEVDNIGFVKLFPKQKEHYLSYFLLLLSLWEVMPSEYQINDLRIFIKKYYKNKMFLNIFNQAVENNKIYINKFKTVLNNCLNK